MTSYQRRLQEIKALKERVAQLEALLSPAEVRQLDQDYINKRRSQALKTINIGGISTIAVPQEPFKRYAIRDSAHPCFTIQVDESGKATYFEDDKEVDKHYFLNHYGYSVR